MKLDDLVAVSGIPGVFKLALNKKNGLIVEDLDSGKKTFRSSRKHQFTPMGSVSIYTEGGDSAMIGEIFKTMEALLNEQDTAPPSVKASSFDLKDYFEKVLPNYDKNRVYVSDMKKVIKWFNFLNSRDLLDFEEEEEENEGEEGTEDKEEGDGNDD